MRSFQPAGLLVFCLGSVACTATMVNLPGGSAKRSAYAPVNEAAPMAGLIKYSRQGAESALKARRQDAYRQMFDACAGSYRIEAEGPKQEGGLVVPVTEGAAAAPAQGHWFIQFTCVPKTTGGVAAVPSETTTPLPQVREPAPTDPR
jgi:hypothetical protein